MAMTLKAAFNPRANSIGFLRWLLATAVIFSHAGPLAGFYGSKNLGSQWSDEQSFGGVAVAGFFFLSGFLITKSRMGRSTLARFLWRRVLRIMPAFWAALIVTAFLLAPFSWWHVHHTLSGYFSSSTDSPLTYFAHNMWLHMTQHNIAGMGSTLPFAKCCGYDWNGSAWTLLYEFSGYLAIGALGLVAFLAYRRLALAVLGLWLLLNTLTFLAIPVHIGVLAPLMNNLFAVMLLTPFFFGMVFALYDDKIVVDDRIALAAAAIAFYTYFIAHGWNIYGQFAFLYVLMWCAVRLPLRNWERPGDLSYGIYIYAWPIMQVAAFFHLQDRGWIAYHVGVLAAAHVAAFLSWHLLEKRALALKNWTPQWVLAAQRGTAPAVARLRRAVDVSDFSSTRFAASLRAGALDQPPSGDLVTHDPAARVQPRHGPDGEPAVQAGRARRRRRARLPAVAAATAVVVGAGAFVALGWGLPAVYHDRYEAKHPQVALGGVVGASGQLVPPHAVPTAAQTASFAAHTATAADKAAITGRDGFVFFGDEFAENFSQAMGRRYYTPQQVIDTEATLRAEQQWLARQHIGFAFVIVPAKWDIYPDKLPQWTDGARLPTIYDQIDAYDPGLTVDLRPALRDARGTADTYSRLNSHWTPYGAFVAYRELASRLAASLVPSVPGVAALRTPVPSGVETRDVQNEFTAINGDHAPNNWTVPRFGAPFPPYHLADSAGTDATVPGDHTVDMMTMPLQTTSAAAGNSVRALILCDSAITSISPYFAGAFGATMMVRHYVDEPANEPNLPALVAGFRPNLVIMMVSERELNYPLTNHLAMWQAANRFDQASGPEVALAGSPGSGRAIRLAMPAAMTNGGIVRLSVTAAATGTVTVTAATAKGPVATRVALAKGPNTTYFEVPAGASAVELSGPVAALSGLTAVARPLSG